jgi:hypothetical protein
MWRRRSRKGDAAEMAVCSCLPCTERGDENSLGENSATCQGYEQCIFPKWVAIFLFSFFFILMSSSYRKLKWSCFQCNRFCGDCSRKRDAPRFRAYSDASAYSIIQLEFTELLCLASSSAAARYACSVLLFRFTAATATAAVHAYSAAYVHPGTGMYL